MIDTIAYNKLYASDKNKNNIYCPMGSFFDTLINSIVDNIISIKLDHEFVSYITYNKLIINDISKNINFITSLPSIPYILLIHEDLSAMKKEDIFLIKNKIQNNLLLNFNPKNSKIFENSFSYCVPKPQKRFGIKNITKNILVLNNIKYNSVKYDIKNFIDFTTISSYNDIGDLIEPYDTIVCSNTIDHMIVQSFGVKTIDINDFNSLLINHNAKHKSLTINYDISSFSNHIKKVFS